MTGSGHQDVSSRSLQLLAAMLALLTGPVTMILHSLHMLLQLQVV